MCGIAGWINWNRRPSYDLVHEMTNRMHHRGPDFGKVTDLGPAIFGHRRLSIIDHDIASNQPMQSSCGNYWLVFNGEIYNYQSLKDKLKSLGVNFSTNSDSEVLLELFARWGAESISMLNGMFAFAVWDVSRQRLTLVRDRAGEKPVYFGSDGFGGLIFSSELAPLRLHPNFQKGIDLEALNQYLTLNYVTGPLSLLSGVSKLLPGTYLEFTKSKLEQKQYWSLQNFYKSKRTIVNENYAAEELRDLIDDATKLRMVADVPIGAFLSGGIDSATIVSAMQEGGMRSKINTFSVGFSEKGYSELNEAEATADYLQTYHHNMMVGGNIEHEFRRVISRMDEPVADTSFIPFYYLAKFSRESVTVALSGDGGDELLAGYETYAADKIHHFTKIISPNLVSPLEYIVKKFIPVSHGKVSFDYKLRKFISGHTLTDDEAHNSWRSIFSENEKKELINGDYSKKILSSDPYSYFKEQANLVSECNYLDRAMFVDTKTWLPDDILAKVDRATMAHSLECRAPFLDHRVMEFCASLPVNLKMKYFNKKYLLKKSQISRLPKSLLCRKKLGFNAPISTWMNGDLYDLMYEITTKGRLEEYFNLSEIGNLWARHSKGYSDNSYKLFGLTCLAIWFDS